MSIRDTIEGVQENLRKGLYSDEAAVSLGIVLPILNALEWPVFDTTVVTPQYPVAKHPERRVVDYALMRRDGHVAVLVEVKRVGGIDADSERQLFEYAFHKGVPLAVLTDGQEWNFYLPLELGGYQDRQVYKFDLLSRDTEECERRLNRYLSKSDVLKGLALENMRSDLQDSIRDDQIEKTLLIAWESLLMEGDDSFIEALTRRVADLCGYEPDFETCTDFLASESKRVQTTYPRDIRLRAREVEGRTVSGDVSPQIGFVLHGTAFPRTNATSVFTSLFEVMSERDPTFCERFASRKHGTKRRYLALSKEELYPGKPDIAERHTFQLVSGWLLGTYYSKKAMEKIIMLACEVAGLEIGNDLVINLGQ
ncbi:MAG: hypothetical protein OXN21_02815 [Chloroflexota bacterium]|nr:hypothetical protein [Chloroflexota bacterium]